MSHTSKLTRRGQTTIPDEIRHALHVKPGDTLEYEVTSQSVLLRVKQPDLTKVLETYLGVFGGVFGQADSHTEQDVVPAQRESRGWDEHDVEVLEEWAKE